MNKCNYKDCEGKKLKIIGECKSCKGCFCSKHRLIEMHKCKELDSIKAEKKAEYEKAMLEMKVKSKKI